MKVLLLSALVLTICAPAFGQVQEIKATLASLTCGTCFNGALLALKQLPGVSGATGDARGGWIRVSVDSKKGVVINDVVERVRLAGLNDASFEMKASGTLQRRGDRLLLIVPNQKETIILDAGDRQQMAMNVAQNQERVSTSGTLSGSGKQFGLKIQTLRKQ